MPRPAPKTSAPLPLHAFASTAMRIARNGSMRAFVDPFTARRMGQASATTSTPTPTSVIGSESGGTSAE
jgi:hypothetical protein